MARSPDEAHRISGCAQWSNLHSRWGSGQEDVDRFDTAMREFEEEMGVNLRQSHVVSGLSERFIPPSRFVVTAFVAAWTINRNGRLIPQRWQRCSPSRWRRCSRPMRCNRMPLKSNRCEGFLTGLCLGGRSHLGSDSHHADGICPRVERGRGTRVT